MSCLPPQQAVATGPPHASAITWLWQTVQGWSKTTAQHRFSFKLKQNSVRPKHQNKLVFKRNFHSDALIPKGAGPGILSVSVKIKPIRIWSFPLFCLLQSAVCSSPARLYSSWALQGSSPLHFQVKKSVWMWKIIWMHREVGKYKESLNSNAISSVISLSYQLLLFSRCSLLLSPVKWQMATDHTSYH